MKARKRIKNERQFRNWEEAPDGSRIYWFEIQGRFGWKARYVKEVDADENTTSFRQEIFDETGKLTEIHEKYPVDSGHIKL